MKAIAIDAYGGSDRLHMVDLPRPPVGPDVVLVRVVAAGVNPVDWRVREGQLAGFYPAHFPLVPGFDMAGVVDEVGAAVWEFAPGDEVCGYIRRDDVQHGTYAELVPAPARTLAPRPRSMSFEESAALPLSGLTALQLLHAVTVERGDTVLVTSATGGVGHLAVQLAQHMGAKVIGVAGEANAEFLRGLGAQPVTYGEGLADRLRAAAPGGVNAVVDTIGGVGLEIAATLLHEHEQERLASVVDPVAVRALGGRYVWVRPDSLDLASLVAMVELKRLRVFLHRTFALADAAAAQDLVQAGHVRGKVALTV